MFWLSCFPFFIEWVQITTRENAAKVVVDGNEISDVLEYELKEDSQGAVLTLRICVRGTIEARIE